MPKYTVLEHNPDFMYHVDRQRGYETHCDGCAEDFGTRWPHGTLVAVVTDRSGSEQATTHNDRDCVEWAIARLAEWEQDA